MGQSFPLTFIFFKMVGIPPTSDTWLCGAPSISQIIPWMAVRESHNVVSTFPPVDDSQSFHRQAWHLPFSMFWDLACEALGMGWDASRKPRWSREHIPYAPYSDYSGPHFREILDFCWINVGKSPTMGPWGIVFIPVLVDSFFIPEWRAARNAYLLTFGVVTFLLEAACVK